MLASPSRISPASGASCPLTRLKQVVLPAPFGPIIADQLARADAKRDAAHAPARRRTALDRP